MKTPTIKQLLARIDLLESRIKEMQAKPQVVNHYHTSNNYHYPQQYKYPGYWPSYPYGPYYSTTMAGTAGNPNPTFGQHTTFGSSLTGTAQTTMGWNTGAATSYTNAPQSGIHNYGHGVQTTGYMQVNPNQLEATHFQNLADKVQAHENSPAITGALQALQDSAKLTSATTGTLHFMGGTTTAQTPSTVTITTTEPKEETVYMTGTGWMKGSPKK